MERNSQFMSLPKSMVDALQKEEMLLVAGGSVGQEASTTNNADGTCSGTNNDSGKCSVRLVKITKYVEFRNKYVIGIL